MGNIMISLNDDKELILRQMAKEKHGGRKGAISAVVSEGIDELAKKSKRFRAMKHQLALMEKGFNFGLKRKKAYEKRSEIYD